MARDTVAAGGAAAVVGVICPFANKTVINVLKLEVLLKKCFFFLFPRYFCHRCCRAILKSLFIIYEMENSFVMMMVAVFLVGTWFNFYQLGRNGRSFRVRRRKKKHNLGDAWAIGTKNSSYVKEEYSSMGKLKIACRSTSQEGSQPTSQVIQWVVFIFIFCI